MRMIRGSKIGAWAFGAVECLNLFIPLMTFCVLVGFADRGFDVSDEGLYLITAQYPSDVKAFPSASYAYLALLFRAVGCNIVKFRIAAIVLTAASGAVLFWGLMRILKSADSRLEEVLPGMSAVSLSGVGALLYYAWGLCTPSYNFLNAFALTLSAGLILLALSTGAATPLRRRMEAGCFLGAGFCSGMSFFSRFPAGVSSIVLYAILLLVWSGEPGGQRAEKVKHVGLLAVGLGLLVLFHFAFIQSFAEWWSVLLSGIHVTTALQSGHGLSSFSRYGQELKALLQSPIYDFWPAFLLLLSGFALTEIVRRRGWGGRRPLVAVMLAVFLVTAFLSYLKGLHRGGIPFVYGVMTFYFMWLALLLCCLGLSAWCWREEIRQMDGRPWRKMFLVVGLLVALPFVGAVGTGNAITSGAIFCMAPWLGGLLLLLVFVASLCGTRWIVTTGAAVIGTFAFVQIVSAGLCFPYRLNGGVLRQIVPTEIGSPPTMILLDPATSEFFKTLRNVAAANGFKTGDDVLAFHNKPGIVFALGGRSPGLQWYFSGYLGARTANEMGLSLAQPERLNKAFILEGLDSPDAMPDLQRFGLRFPEDYRLCGRFVWPLTKETVVLWKPRDVMEEGNEIP